MRQVRQLFFGLFSALASGMIILAAASLTLVEGGGVDALRAAPPTQTAAAPAANTPATTAIAQTPATQTVVDQITPQPSPTACPHPTNWQMYIVQPGDDLATLAQDASVSVETLLRANCMISPALMPNTTLFLPALGSTFTPLAPTLPSLPTAAPSDTPIPCRPRAGWIAYIVQPGDNLYRLSQAFGISQQELQAGNCMFGSVTIYAGRKIYVPNVSTRVPTRENTPVSPTRTLPAATPTTQIPTPTPTAAAATAVPTATGTNTVTPTTVASPTETATLETVTATATPQTIQEPTATP